MPELVLTSFVSTKGVILILINSYRFLLVGTLATTLNIIQCYLYTCHTTLHFTLRPPRSTFEYRIIISRPTEHFRVVVGIQILNRHRRLSAPILYQVVQKVAYV